MKKQKIGFVGLGLMGSQMVKNLVSERYTVLGFDIDPKKVAASIAIGAMTVDMPDRLAGQVDVIMMSLPNSNVVEQTLKNDLRIFETGRRGLILIDMTTADPVASETLADQLRQHGIEMLDSTVSGGPASFSQKTATLMVGGNEDIFNMYRPILSVLSNSIFYTGKNGSGATMKLLVNLISGLSRMVLGEGLTLCKRVGIDQKRLMDILKHSRHASKSMDGKATRMIEKDFLPAAGKLAFHLKDVQLMLDLGKRLNCPLPLACLHAQALTSLVAKGRGEWDNTAIVTFFEDLANM